MDLAPDEIGPCRTIGYGIGHFYNDAVAASYGYLMIYLQKVLQYRGWQAGMVLLLAQVLRLGYD